MSTTTITVKVTRECKMTIQCEACDHIYDFVGYLKNESSSSAWNPVDPIQVGYAEKVAEARTKAMDSALRGIEDKTKRFEAGDYSVISVSNIEGTKPCPQCGYLQAWMVKNIEGNHITGLVISIGWAAFCIIVGIVISLTGDQTTLPLAFLVGVIPGGIGAFLSIAALREHPNQAWMNKNGKAQNELPPQRAPIRTSIGPLIFG